MTICWELRAKKGHPFSYERHSTWTSWAFYIRSASQCQSGGERAAPEYATSVVECLCRADPGWPTIALVVGRLLKSGGGIPGFCSPVDGEACVWFPYRTRPEPDGFSSLPFFLARCMVVSFEGFVRHSGRQRVCLYINIECVTWSGRFLIGWLYVLWVGFHNRKNKGACSMHVSRVQYNAGPLNDTTAHQKSIQIHAVFKQPIRSTIRRHNTRFRPNLNAFENYVIS